MITTLVPDLNFKTPAKSIDTCWPYLAVSLPSDTISIFSLIHPHKPIAVSPLINSCDITRFYKFPFLFCGTGEGILISLNICLETQSIKIQSTHKIHEIGIQDIVLQEDKAFTCGIDNYVHIYQVIECPNEISLVKKHSFKAHNGWVTGMCLSDKYLLTQGSDSRVSFWALDTYKKKMEVRFEQEEQPYSAIWRPLFKAPYFFVPNLKSEVNGEACLTIIREEDLKLIQISFEDLIVSGHTNKKRRFNRKEWMIDVQGYGVLGQYIIVASMTLVMLFTDFDFELVDRFYLEDGDEVVVIEI